MTLLSGGGRMVLDISDFDLFWFQKPGLYDVS
jgi:hypothetical protein